MPEQEQTHEKAQPIRPPDILLLLSPLPSPHVIMARKHVSGLWNKTRSL